MGDLKTPSTFGMAMSESSTIAKICPCQRSWWRSDWRDRPALQDYGGGSQKHSLGSGCPSDLAISCAAWSWSEGTLSMLWHRMLMAEDPCKQESSHYARLSNASWTLYLIILNRSFGPASFKRKRHSGQEQRLWLVISVMTLPRISALTFVDWAR